MMEATKQKMVRNMDDENSRRYWEQVEKRAQLYDSWPEWLKEAVLERSPDTVANCKGRFVTASSEILQSPISENPHVPSGMRGVVEDVDHELEPPLLVVNFGQPFGTLLCELGEVDG